MDNQNLLSITRSNFSGNTGSGENNNGLVVHLSILNYNNLIKHNTIMVMGMLSNRPLFTRPQLVQADYIGRVTEEHHHQRQTMITHAIDNVTPEIVADRDDGIFVEVEPASQGYQVHVTIADVAAHVRPKSPLSEAAWQRAFTLYKPGSTDSMFPKILEENLSLEHGQERLGLTITMLLDEHFKPVRTRFVPVVTTPDNVSYAQASRRIAHDPQFGLMANIAEGIKRSFCISNGAAWNELVDDRRMRQGRGENETNSMDMVAAYMLLANHCVAEFFNASGLPFLYRNFDDALDTHASYGTGALGHTAIESMGLAGAYCHITSPIRRAPDYLDGAMMHYVVDMLTQIERKMQASYPSLDSRKLNDSLWQHGPEIMKLVATSTATRASLNSLLYRIAKDVAPEIPPDRIRISLANDLNVPPLPFTKLELDDYAAHINALAHSSEMTRIARENQRIEESWQRLEGIETKSKDTLETLSPEKFSSILQAAAMTGVMPANLFTETMHRITGRNPNRTGDLFNVFIRAQYPGSDSWKALKRVAAREIKNDPSTVNALLYRLEEYIQPAQLQNHFEVHNHVSCEALPERVKKALLVLKNEDGSQWAAPFCSVGHDDRAARSHACYSFLEHYAFGELQPVEQTAVPNWLYAQLDMPGTKKRELIEQMIQDAGADISIATQKIRFGHRTTITVSGGDVNVPITQAAEAESEEAAIRSALGHILRNDAFRIAMSRHEVIGQDLLNPQTVLEQELAKLGGSVEITVLPLEAKTGVGFQATATVHLYGEDHIFTAVEPNKDRARRVVAAQALVESFDEAMPVSPHIASWASYASVSDNA